MDLLSQLHYQQEPISAEIDHVWHWGSAKVNVSELNGVSVLDKVCLTVKQTRAEKCLLFLKKYWASYSPAS